MFQYKLLKICHDSYLQDDHLTAGAWAAYG